MTTCKSHLDETLRAGQSTYAGAGSFFFSSRRRHTRFDCDWSSDVCSSDLRAHPPAAVGAGAAADGGAVVGPVPGPLRPDGGVPGGHDLLPGDRLLRGGDGDRKSVV